MKILIKTLFLFYFGLSIYAQKQPSPILFIYDASGSMWGQIEGKTKKEIASNVLASTINNLPKEQNIGLIVYGHRTKGDCDDIQYMVDLKNLSKENITNAIESINPTGKTPLARSTTKAINSIKNNNSKGTIILITDGIESCDGDICKVVTDAKEKDIDFKLHIVGFGIKKDGIKQLKCAAIAGEGNYYDADDTAGLTNALTKATNNTVDDLRGNFSIYAEKNGQAVDVWVKAKSMTTKKQVDASRTYRDTAFVYLPPGKYEVGIKPLENTNISATSIFVDIIEGETKHRDINFDSGKINVSTLNNGKGWDATVRVFNAGMKKQVASNRTYGKSKELELEPGVYDVNILLLKVKGISVKHTIENVEVKPNQTTPISHNFESGVAMIGVQSFEGDLIDATVNFIEVSTGINVDGSRTYTSKSSNPRKFVLNPGTYYVKIKTLGTHKGHSDTITVEVKAGESIEKILTY